MNYAMKSTCELNDLKQCASSLQKAYGGSGYTPELLPVQVSLTRQGYPRIIPPFHPFCKSSGDEKEDILVKVYLSFFSL